jgi:hypothetical protein
VVRLLGVLFFLRRAGADQAFQFAVEPGLTCIGQFEEAERLQASVGGPHREQHLRAAADAGGTEVKHNRHFDALIERLLQRNQPAVGGKLIHTAANLAAALEHHHGQNATPEADTCAASFLRVGGRGHFRCNFHPDEGNCGRLPKSDCGPDLAPTRCGLYPLKLRIALTLVPTSISGWRNSVARARMLGCLKEAK